MKYKLFAIDIDDTLITTDRVLTPENLSAMKRAEDMGVHIVIATGRTSAAAKPVWDLIKTKAPSLTYGGAVVCDFNTGKVFKRSVIPPELVKDALEFAHENGFIAQIYSGDSVVTEFENPHTTYYTNILKVKAVYDPNIRTKLWQDIPKVLYYSNPSETDKNVKMIAERYEGVLSVRSSSSTLIDLNNFDADKGHALEFLANMLDIPIEQTVAIGDSLLDLPMIEKAGLGVAVENSHDAVLSGADIIAPHCNDNAVAWVIDNIILA